MFRLLAILSAAVLACQAAAQSASEVTYYNDVSGFLHRPDTSRTVPGVILIHDWTGPSAKMQAEAARFAEEGYVTLLVDVFAGQPGPASAEASIRMMRGQEQLDGFAGMMTNIEAGRAFLAEQPGVDPNKIAVVGFDLGAPLALKAAIQGVDFSAVVAYEPRPGALMDPGTFDMANLEEPVLSHLAESNERFYAILSFEERVKERNENNLIFRYPLVDPGFTITVDGKFDSAAAKLARKRSFQFLETYF